ncbi:18817_t:CDS:1, partial [Racocetra fulgida]
KSLNLVGSFYQQGSSKPFLNLYRYNLVALGRYIRNKSRSSLHELSE